MYAVYEASCSESRIENIRVVATFDYKAMADRFCKFAREKVRNNGTHGMVKYLVGDYIPIEPPVHNPHPEDYEYL